MEDVWQLNPCQKIARLLVPLPSLQVHRPVVLALAFPKDYRPALQSISLRKHRSHQWGMHRRRLGQRNNFPGAVQSRACQLSHRLYLLSQCLYLSSCCRATTSSCTMEKWCKKKIKKSWSAFLHHRGGNDQAQLFVPARCGFSSGWGWISHLLAETWQRGDAALLW